MMEFAQAYYWLGLSEKRKIILASLNQPLTATQVARRTDIGRDSCLHHLWSLTLHKILRCLNKDTRYIRLYWLTGLGEACQRRMHKEAGRGSLVHRYPKIPWNLYSSVCYRHRSAVIEAMRGQMQAAVIKRRAFSRDSTLRMSANNVRDVMKWLVETEAVQKIRVRKKKHPRYELTDLGLEFQKLLLGVKVPCPKLTLPGL